MLMGVGAVLRAARRRNGLTQQQLAARAGTTRSAIARLEGERVSPTVATLERLLLAMGEELEISSIRLREPRGAEGLGRELERSMSQRVETALGFDDFANETVGSLADR